MFDQSKLKMQYRPRLPGMNFTRKRPGFQKRMEPPPIPRQLNKPLSKKFTNIPTKPIQPLTIKPTPTFKSKVVPTFTSYNATQKQKKRLSCPTVRPTRTLNKLPTKSMLSPRHTPETPDSGFVSQDPTLVALKTKSKPTRHGIRVTRQKRKLPRDDDDEYRPKLKKRRTRKQQPSFSFNRAQFEEPNYKWRDKAKIAVPDIFELTPDEWPEDDDDFDETLDDITNQAFYVRHFRAEQRERIFYEKLQKWRDKEAREQAFQREQKLRVADRPRGPWQVKLPKSIERGPSHIPQEILSQPSFNYHWHGKWTQPVMPIRRLVRKLDQKPRTRQLSCRGGKDLNHLGYSGFYSHI